MRTIRYIDGRETAQETVFVFNIITNVDVFTPSVTPKLQ